MRQADTASGANKALRRRDRDMEEGSQGDGQSRAQLDAESFGGRQVGELEADGLDDLVTIKEKSAGNTQTSHEQNAKRHVGLADELAIFIDL